METRSRLPYVREGVRDRMDRYRQRRREATPAERKARRTRLKRRIGNAGLPARLRKRALERFVRR
jgi:hypothetical protein